MGKIDEYPTSAAGDLNAVARTRSREQRMYSDVHLETVCLFLPSVYVSSLFGSSRYRAHLEPSARVGRSGSFLFAAPRWRSAPIMEPPLVRNKKKTTKHERKSRRRVSRFAFGNGNGAFRYELDEFKWTNAPTICLLSNNVLGIFPAFMNRLIRRSLRPRRLDGRSFTWPGPLEQPSHESRLALFFSSLTQSVVSREIMDVISIGKKKLKTKVLPNGVFLAQSSFSVPSLVRIT